jgi:trehalose/maltose hydrolase-like predicted phosphorylase
MLFYLLSADELRELLEGLGYALPPEAITHTVEYYLERTTHGSTLSALVHAWVLARNRRQDALDHFECVLRSDIADVQGGTTAEGIHLGAMAGTLDLLQRAFTGLQTREQQLWLDPVLPDGLTRLEFPIQFRRHHGVHVTITHDRLVVSGQEHTQAPVRLHVGPQRYALGSGATYEVPLTR